MPAMPLSWLDKPSEGRHRFPIIKNKVSLVGTDEGVIPSMASITKDRRSPRWPAATILAGFPGPLPPRSRTAHPASFASSLGHVEPRAAGRRMEGDDRPLPGDAIRTSRSRRNDHRPRGPTKDPRSATSSPPTRPDVAAVVRRQPHAPLRGGGPVRGRVGPLERAISARTSPHQVGDDDRTASKWGCALHLLPSGGVYYREDIFRAARHRCPRDSGRPSRPPAATAARERRQSASPSGTKFPLDRRRLVQTT